MATACPGLQDAIAVGVANDFNRVCPHDGAWLTYRDFERSRLRVVLRDEAVTTRRPCWIWSHAARSRGLKRSISWTSSPFCAPFPGRAGSPRRADRPRS
jgi:hypothetical protein